MHVRVGGCGNILWGISFLITFMIILTILFTFTLVKIFCQYTENCWENRPNLQGKENSSAQYAVKIVPHRAAYMCKGLYSIFEGFTYDLLLLNSRLMYLCTDASSPATCEGIYHPRPDVTASSLHTQKTNACMAVNNEGHHNR